MSLAQLREMAIIWTVSLVLAGYGLRAAERVLPGPFAEVKTQIGVEKRDLVWALQGASAGSGGLSLGSLALRLDASDNALARELGGHVVVHREDLLERTSAGLR